MELNNVYNMDCVEGMQQMEDASVDLIIADPPYVIAREGNFHTMNRAGTDFGEWDYDFDNEPYLTESYRLLKPGGSLLTFNDFKKATTVYDITEKLGFEYKDTLVWKKTNPIPRNRDRRYVPDVEMVQWYIKPGNAWTFNRQQETYESSVISFPVEGGTNSTRFHPTQKPEKLVEYFIRMHSNKGDIVLDPFMGSGTTAVAAINQKRHFFGFERNETYFLKLQDRLKREERKPKGLFI